MVMPPASVADKARPQAGLAGKLAALVVGVVLFVVLVLGVYFDYVIRGHFRAQAQEQIEHGLGFPSPWHPATRRLKTGEARRRYRLRHPLDAHQDRPAPHL